MKSRVLSEIEETPAVLERLLADADGTLQRAAGRLARTRPSGVAFVARGSSFCAALYGRYLIETLLGLPVTMVAPSVASVYGRDVDYHDLAAFALSQGGRSPDILAATASAARSAATTIVVVNDMGSPLATAGDLLIRLGAGSEAITATKSYVAELAALAAVIARWAEKAELVTALQTAPSAVETVIRQSSTWIDEHPNLVEALGRATRVQVVSRGYDHATAMETSIKLTECTGLFAQAYSASDFRHGFAVASGPDVPLIAIRPDGEAGPSVDVALEDARERGAEPWLIGGRSVEGWPRCLALAHGLPPALAPIVNIVPGQLLAERAARARGRDPDRPAGLQKVILTT